MPTEVIHAFNPSIWKVNAGKPRIQDQPGVHVFLSTVSYIDSETHLENTKAAG